MLICQSVCDQCVTERGYLEQLKASMRSVKNLGPRIQGRAAYPLAQLHTAS